jgi:hypothetical protein
MDYIRFLHKNIWRRGTVLSTTSKQTQFPAEETQNDSRQFFWRSAVGGDSDANIIVDCGVAEEYNMVCLLNHNISAGATITFYGADDSGFTTNVVSDVLTRVASNIYAFLGSLRTKRYLKIRVQDGSNPNDYIQIGPVVVGKYWTVSENPSYGYEQGNVDYSEVDFTDGMVASARVKQNGAYFRFPFRSLDGASATSVRALNSEVGGHSPFVMCLDYNYPNTNTYFMRQDRVNNPLEKAPDLWEWDLEAVEVF